MQVFGPGFLLLLSFISPALAFLGAAPPSALKLNTFRGGGERTLPSEAASLNMVNSRALEIAGQMAWKERDVLGAAMAEMGNIRVPAALLAGATLGQLFYQPDQRKNRRLQGLHVVFSCLSFTLHLTAVLVATATTTNMASLPSPMMALSPMHFLMSSYELEFITIRSSFIMGIITFTISLVCKSWLAFKEPLFAKFLTGVLTTALFLGLNFFQSLVDHEFPLCFKGMSMRVWKLLPSILSRRRLLRHGIFVCVGIAVATWVSRGEEMKQGQGEGANKPKRS